jgi:hypothetical protein
MGYIQLGMDELAERPVWGSTFGGAGLFLYSCESEIV